MNSLQKKTLGNLKISLQKTDESILLYKKHLKVINGLKRNKKNV